MTLTDDSPVARDIRRHNIGGVVLFDRDVALNTPERNIQSPGQVLELTGSLQRFCETPLFIAIDQEGGRVCRLKEAYGFPPTVSQQFLGLMNDPALTRTYADQTAATLKSIGINVNFAPVVDLNVNPDNPVIGKLERSFSADADIVVTHAREVIQAHHVQKILTTLKHFPGHGSSQSDSHQGFVDVTGTWTEYELAPYQKIIEEGLADFVMSAHVFNAHLDLYHPATLSRSTITGILRDRFRFTGIIFSDDMQMKAITERYGLENAIELALTAGIDVLVFGNNMVYDEKIAGRAAQIIENLIKSKKVKAGQVEASLQRISEYKQKWLSR
jgi:beta-N-acetylhexosaminidase